MNDSTRTTVLGYAKYAITALTWIAAMLGVSIGAGDQLILPDPGSKWYVYAIIVALGILRMAVGMLQSKAMADAAQG